MRYNKLAFVALVVAFIAAAVFATNGPATAQEAVDVAPGLREAIVEGDGGMYVVVMRNQADLSAAYDMDWNTRGHFVYNTLVETARVSQADLLDYLRAQGIRGQTIYTANAVIVESGVEVFDAITARGDVLAVEYHHIFEVPELEPVTIDESVDVVEWGVDKINAPDIWAQGFFGSDIVVGSIDTGIDPDHPALVSNYRGAIRGSDDHAFFDPSNICSGAVCDNNNHGTHTIGTMVGDDGAGNQIGVAPQAEVIASKGCESNSCSTAALLASFDWMVAPCDFGDAPGSPSCDPNERPHVVNNSWGGGTGNTTWIASIEALHAAGIIPVFSAGNSGPGAGTVGSPGDYCDVIGVGATDINDMIASFSSRGPVTCVDTAPVFPNTSKPDVSAPGVNVRSSIDGGGYANFQGTSMAAPHVAGCIALLLEAGAQDYLEAWDALTTTAVDLGSTGFDNDYGFGRIDCFEAFDTLSLIHI
ncbi:MAG: S8 family serine peptidase, partial [Chloroflexi bacterium]|nr:S8 family serine peptidase [Chloroflexota bacterium]